MAERTTDLRTTGHRRLVIRTIVTALRAVFDDDYNRDPQFRNLKVTPDFPLKREDYPCVVVEYAPERIVNAGVGHVEWFMDENDVLRKWGHRRFEGTLTLHIMGLTPLDRDLLADAVEEVIEFGPLDTTMQEFRYKIYGYPDDPWQMIFSQLMLDTDEITGGGNSASIAPWAPEDQLVHDTSLELQIHGGIYNIIPNEEWGYVTAATAESYPQFEDVVTLPFGDLATPWTNPFEFDDDAEVTGVAVISGEES